jgi:MFS family permease
VRSKRGGESFGSRFWTLFSAFTASNLGDGLSLVGFPLLAVSLTDDARLVAFVAAARVVPFLVIGLPAGVIIDRFDRRHLAMLAQLARGATLLFVGFATAGDRASITMLVITGFVVGVGEVLTDGGLPAVVRDVVKKSQLEDANGRLRASETVANLFIGPPVGALMFQFSNSSPFFLAAVLYAITIVFLANLHGDFKPEQDANPGSFIAQMGLGLSYVWNHSVLRPLAFAVAAFSFVSSAHHAMLVVLATERLGLSEFQYGLLLAADAVTAVIMAFFVSRLVRRTSHGFSMQVSVFTFAVHAFILGFFTFIPMIIFAAFLGGIADPTWNVISATVRQRLVDDEIFGRMMTAYLFIAWSMQPLGTIAGGVVAEAWGPEWVYIISGSVVGSLLFFARPLFHRINAAMANAA